MIYYSNHLPVLLADDSPCYRYDGDVTLADIKRFMTDRYRKKPDQICIHELGVDRYRFDFVSVDPHYRHVRILEYKVTKGDFDGDTKHLDYMHYCNTLAFVTPLGMVGAGDLKDERVGLLQVFKWAHRGQDDWRLGAVWVKKPVRMRVQVETYYRVVDMLLLRIVQGRKGDFF